ncbi:MAG: hypothetical protein ACT4OX_04875 [Actinomycetota bacterium]
MTEFVVGFVVGASVVMLACILIPLTRRIRAERPLPTDVETQLLLGLRPDEPEPPPASPPAHPRPYSSDDLAQLRRLGNAARKRR